MVELTVWYLTFSNLLRILEFSHLQGVLYGGIDSLVFEIFKFAVNFGIFSFAGSALWWSWQCCADQAVADANSYKDVQPANSQYFLIYFKDKKSCGECQLMKMSNQRTANFYNLHMT